MKPIFVRPAQPSDNERFSKWAISTPNNEIDPEILTYRTTTMKCAFKGDKVLVFLPVSRPFVLESLAINPEATELEIASGIKELVQDIVSIAFLEGTGEIYFLGTNSKTNQFAKNHGFDELPWKVFRLKLSSLEK